MKDTMSPSKLGNTRLIQRLSTQLNFGLQQVKNYRKSSNESFADLTTYYLLKDKSLVTFREWYQLGRPDYLFSGSRKGCLASIGRKHIR